MGIRFHRSIKLLPGIRLNISKKGVGVSAGVKGYRVSVGPSGVHRTMSIPGTGLSRIDQIAIPEQHTSQPHSSPDQYSLFPVPPDVEEPALFSSSITRTENNLPKRISPKLAYTCSVGIIVTACSFMLLAALSTIPRKEPEKASSISVNEVVSTMVAQTTQQAIVTQMFVNLTQTSLAKPSMHEQTQTVLIPTEVKATNTPCQLIPQEEPTDIRIISSPTTPLQATNYVLPLTTPIPLTKDQNLNSEPSQPGSGICCKHCVNTKACGDGCINKNYTCTKPPGCACDG